MTNSPRRILILQGHPDASTPHLCHALAQAYAEGAVAAGHTVRTVEVARLDFPLLRSQHEWETGPVPADLLPVQADLTWAEHVVLFFPLWLGDMPALLKAFLEQVARPGFAVPRAGSEAMGTKLLAGRSARVVVTMGMPALLYRWYFRAHSVRSLERNILGFVGFAPVRETLIGLVDRLGAPGVAQWQARLRKLGGQAQ
ncbi:NAD(P)H-dependent oxidoreductase [Roseateles sp. BYS87W]|uniref:NAD(P)H-dependent oxidoreductase n=1 Tax=Pelomonas baiyunensis TaxID=3299026 RepID=A0ABW7H4C4_9BURK